MKNLFFGITLSPITKKPPGSRPEPGSSQDVIRAGLEPGFLVYSIRRREYKMKKKILFTGILAVALVFGLALVMGMTLTACNNPASDNPGVDNPGGDNPGSDNPGGDNSPIDTEGDGLELLSPPNNVQAVALSATSIKITWGSVAGSTAYAVYWSEDNDEFFWVDTVSGLSYVDDDAEFVLPATTYYYAVTAIDSSDNESDLSEVVWATTHSITTAPSAPTVVTATAISSTSVMTLLK
jgi:hypothetical protein